MHSSIKISLTLLAAIIVSGQTSQKLSTNPVPPEYSSKYIERINLSTEVPVPVDRFRYVVTGDINGVTYYTGMIPLIAFENSETYKAKVGEVAVGTELKLEKITSHAGRMYYGVEIKTMQGSRELTKIGWLDGTWVKIAGTNSQPPVK